MNWPELALSPYASLRVPGVNVPVAAPSWAVVLMSFPSWRRERPCAGGNWSARGCWAGPSWAIAGGGELVAVVLVLAAWEAELEVWVAADEPHPAIARASSGASTLSFGKVMSM